jgi:hypothetical protein
MVKNAPAVVLALAVAVLAAPSIAQEGAAPGQAHSTSFVPLVPGDPIAVRALDDSTANLTLGQHFAAALQKRAMAVQDMPAPLVLNFQTEIDQASRRDIPSVAAASGSSRESEVQVNVWATHRESVLRGRPSDDRGLLRYVLTATLDDERTGRRVWQGEAIYTGAPADEEVTLAAMAGILAEQVGQTVRPRSFRLE